MSASTHAATDGDASSSSSHQPTSLKALVDTLSSKVEAIAEHVVSMTSSSSSASPSSSSPVSSSASAAVVTVVVATTTAVTAPPLRSNPTSLAAGAKQQQQSAKRIPAAWVVRRALDKLHAACGLSSSSSLSLSSDGSGSRGNNHNNSSGGAKKGSASDNTHTLKRLCDGSATSMAILDDVIICLKCVILYFAPDGSISSNNNSTTTTTTAAAGVADESSSSLRPTVAATPSSPSTVPADFVTALAAAVAVLSTLGIDASGTPKSTPRGTAGNASSSSSTSPARNLEQDVRALSLFALVAVCQQHITPMMPALLVLFPDVAIPQLLSNAVKHPLISPLLHDNVYRCRAAAAAAINAILHKAHTFLSVAVEPAPTDRQSFTSLSTRYGKWFRDLHACALHGLVIKETSSCRSLFLILMANLVTATPYARCPQSKAVVAQRVLSLPLIGEFLAKRRDSNDFAAACTLLTSVMRVKIFNATSVEMLTSVSRGGRGCLEQLIEALPAVESWRALVHVFRNFTEVVSSEHVNRIIHASTAIVASSASSSSSSSSSTTVTTVLIECLRCVMHMCGLAWEPFAAVSSSSSGSATSTGGVGGVSSGIAVDDGFDPASGGVDGGAGGGNSESGSTVVVSAASVAQKRKIIQDVYRVALEGGVVSVRTQVYKCLGQIGDDAFLDVSSCQGTRSNGGSNYVDPNAVATKSKKVSSSSPALLSLDKIVSWVVDRGLREDAPGARAEALITLGVWALRYPLSLNGFHAVFERASWNVLRSDRDDHVRAKAAFVLSNICAVVAQQQKQSIPTATSSSAVSSERLEGLCDATVEVMAAAFHCRQRHGLSAQSPATILAGHGVRMALYLLRSLPESMMIMEVAGREDGVANVFLTYLLKFLHTNTNSNVSGNTPSHARASGQPQQQLQNTTTMENVNSATTTTSSLGWDVKTRWGAAHALGEVLSLPSVYFADPPVARSCIARLLSAIVEDNNCKVRSRAAMAIAKIAQEAAAAAAAAQQQRRVGSATTPPLVVAVTPGPTMFQELEPYFPAMLEHLCIALASLSPYEESSHSSTTPTMKNDSPEATSTSTTAKATTTCAASTGGITLSLSPPPPFKEAQALQEQLLKALEVVLRAAPGTSAFQTTLMQHKGLLGHHRLM